MKKMQLIKKLSELDRRGVYVFTRGDMAKLFPEESTKSMDQSLKRVVVDGLLERVARGLYINPGASSKNRWIAEDIAKALRPGNLSYVSLESILSEYGVISQIPIDRMTVMTTGASGLIKTPYGTIEFTHTKRRAADIIKRTMINNGRPMRIATKEAAVRDLLRVGRNVNMMDRSELQEASEGEMA